MERFDVRRGLIKEVEGSGGLAALAKEFFDHVEGSANKSFEASCGVSSCPLDVLFWDGARVLWERPG